MELAYVDELAKDNKDIKNLLVRQDLLERTVDAKRIKVKKNEETVRAFINMRTKMNQLKKNWVDKRRETSGGFQKLCKAEGLQI